jgi:hypothetical protein
MSDKNTYEIGIPITFWIVFIGTWIWCIDEYGFLLGVGLGWLPSAITAALMAFLWPLLLLAIIILALVIFM